MDIRLSDSQKIAINSLISKLSPNTFQENSTENIQFKNIEPEIHLRFRNLFGDGFAKIILNSLQNPSFLISTETNISNSVAPPITTIPADCGCSTKSDYCSCPAALAPYHCPSCSAGGCGTSSGGCGTLWLYSCNGNCLAPVGGE